MILAFFERRRPWFRFTLGLAAGTLLTLAFPPADVRWVAFAAMVPMLLGLRGASALGGAAAGLGFGLGFFGLLLLWLSVAGWIAWGALLVSQVAFAVVFGWLGAWLTRGGAAGRVVAIPMLFAGLEFVRGHVPLDGFAWGSLGSSQHSGLPLLPLARAGGMWSVTLALVGINALLAEALTARRAGRIAALLAAATATVGPAFLPLGAPASGRLDVAVVQGNVPPGHFTDITRGRRGPEDRVILDNHVRLTETLADAPPDLVIWPENALDRDPFANPDFGNEVSRVVAEVGRPALLGAILDAPGGRFYNSNLLIAGDGTTLLGRYDKIHLVPFGEYVPWSWARRFVSELEQIPSDGVPGTAARVLATGSARIGAVICFESTYPDLVRRFVRNGADVLVISTNNATFGTTPLARQHLAQSRMRAVEMGRTVVHAAISGITAIVGPDGTVRAQAGLFRPAVVRRDVALSTEMTPYARHGRSIDGGIAAAGAAAALMALLLGAFRRRPRPATGAADRDDFLFWEAPVARTGAIEPRGSGSTDDPDDRRDLAAEAP